MKHLTYLSLLFFLIVSVSCDKDNSSIDSNGLQIISKTLNGSFTIIDSLVVTRDLTRFRYDFDYAKKNHQ